MRTDSKRGCGWRKEGGLYLVSDGPAVPCGLLPINLDVCPTCGGGVKPARGWTWIDPTPFVARALGVDDFEELPDCRQGDDVDVDLANAIAQTCWRCFERWGARAGLLWVGGSFYPDPADWTGEAIAQGVSRRINSIPRGFVVGETWVLVAHRAATSRDCPGCGGTNDDRPKCVPAARVETRRVDCPQCKGTGREDVAGIFHAFKPQAIEYVLPPDEAELLERFERVKQAVSTGLGRDELELDSKRWLDALIGKTEIARSKKLARLIARGVTPVIVKRREGAQELPGGANAE